MNFKDTININKLFEHLIKQAKSLLEQDNTVKMKKQMQDIKNDEIKRAKAAGDEKKYDDDYINLKELRDLMFNRRCSNGKLFMFGLANENRLGVYIPELDLKLPKDHEKGHPLLCKGL